MRGKAFWIAGVVLAGVALICSEDPRASASFAAAVQVEAEEQTANGPSGEDSLTGGDRTPGAPPLDASPPMVVLPPTPSVYDSVPAASLASWVAKVNGDPISVRLFERRLARNRFSAFQHFRGQYGEVWRCHILQQVFSHNQEQRHHWQYVRVRRRHLLWWRRHPDDHRQHHLSQHCGEGRGHIL